MKRVMGYGLWVMGLVILLSFLQIGCTAKTYSQGKPEDANTWNFGAVEAGAILKHNFVLKNESKQTLNVRDINTSCGCTASKINKKVLLPGESALIEAKFNTKGYAGQVQQFIYVHTDSLDASTPLNINGERNRVIDNPIVRFIIKADVK